MNTRLSSGIRMLGHKIIRKSKTIFLIFLSVGLVLATVGVFFRPVRAQTWVEGHITTNTTWTVADSPYRAINDVIVDPGVLLTIEPGVEVQFADGFSLIVEGSLNAIGTDVNSIVFTSSRNSPTSGVWNTIMFKGNPGEQFLLRWVKLDYAVDGVTVESLGSVTIEKSEISKCSNNGIMLIGESNVIIKENVIKTNKYGVYSLGEFSGIEIIGNHILHNDNYGIILRTYWEDPHTYSPISNTTILGNTVSFNGNPASLHSGEGDGIKLYSDTYISNVTFSGNTISHNGNKGIYLRTFLTDSPIFNVTFSGNTITHNGYDGVHVAVTHARSPIFNVTFSGNTITHNLRDGIYLASGEVGPNVIFFENLVSFGVNRNGISLSAPFFHSSTFNSNCILANREDGIHLSTGKMQNITITNNIVSSNGANGVYLNGYPNDDVPFDVTILKNALSSNGVGIQVYGDGASNITKNLISYNGIGILYKAKSENNLAYDNNIYSNNYGMKIISVASVNAEGNYWGDSTGPYHDSLNPEGRGNSVNGDGTDLDFIPFLTSPVGKVNQRPIAILDVDKTSPNVDETVTFDASASTDDGRIDYYLFDFGDGTNTGWAPPSVVTHKYASEGTRTATLIVMDDFGVSSTNTATKTILVGEFSSLNVLLTLNPTTIGSEGQVSVNVHVTDGPINTENAYVQLVSDKGGTFTPSSGYTDSNGYFSATFIAPSVSEETNVRITATASKSGYADGSDYDYVSVLPPGAPSLSVTVTANPSTIKPDESSTITVKVTDGVNPIPDATVTLSSDNGGTFSQESGNTDSNGVFTYTFTAPSVTQQTTCTITADVTKAGYLGDQGQTQVTVKPPREEEGIELFWILVAVAVISIMVVAAALIAIRGRREKAKK